MPVFNFEKSQTAEFRATVTMVAFVVELGSIEVSILKSQETIDKEIEAILADENIDNATRQNKVKPLITTVHGRFKRTFGKMSDAMLWVKQNAPQSDIDIIENYFKNFLEIMTK